jgi:survival-of-motor-neuron-related-splicing factor 30
MASTEEQLKEYQTQLADVEDMLKASPGDASLLQLKNDLVELIGITRQQSVVEESSPEQKASKVFEQALETAVGRASVGMEEQAHDEERDSLQKRKQEMASNGFASVVQDAADAAAEAPRPTSEEPAKKKKKISEEFEVPQHLIPLDTDSEAEKNRKRRALKAAKSKWRERKKEIVSEKKQKSWQSFQKKKKIKDKSMFSTHDGDSKVGVVSTSGRQLTGFLERKRHQNA